MQILNLALLALAVVAPGYSDAQATEKVHGVVIYSRHGDRTIRMYKGYQVTKLGAKQTYDSGAFYRARYVASNATHKIVNISSDVYKPSQLWVSGPDQAVLLQTATNFLQGLYPPLSQVNDTLAAETLSDGAKASGPLGDYQVVQIHAEDEKDPDTIWLKGSDSCPAWTNASSTYRNSTEYLETLKNSAAFYAQFTDILATNFPASKVNYANAYDVFDVINVGQIHNKSDLVTPEQLDQLRYYANEWESNMNYNRTMPARSIGGASLAGGFLKQLNETVASKGALKLSLMTGSYNTFLAFFGLTNLTTLASTNNFTGLPDYASSMVFELFSESAAGASAGFPAPEALNVRFLFRNGSDADAALTAFPLFGQDRLALPYLEFRSLLEQRAITTPKAWCTTCKQTNGFCSQREYAPDAEATPAVTTSGGSGGSGGGISNAVAGVIGAFVTLGVVAILGGLFFVLRRKKQSARAAESAPALAKKASKDETSSAEVPV